MKNIHKLYIVLIIILPLSLEAQIDQFAIGSIGGSIEASSGAIHFVQSVGDISGTYLQGNQVDFYQGFPQCFNCDGCVEIVNVKVASNFIDFTVSPNPVTDYFRIEGTIQNIHQYSIISSQGKVVITNHFTDPVIDIGQLTGGVYVVQFFDEEHEVVGVVRVVKVE